MTTTSHRRHPAVWAAAAAILLVPLVAMRFTTEVKWTGSDVAFAALLLGSAAGAYEWLAGRAGGGAYRAGARLAVLTGLALVWVNAAVGMIGDEGHAANLLFAGVIAVAVGGAVAARGRAAGMARAMACAACAQAAVAALALAMRWGADQAGWPGDVLGTGVLFTAAWLGAAGLFVWEARKGRP